MRISEILLTLIYTSMLGRFLGAEQFGIYAFAMAFVLIITLVTNAGVGTLVVKEISIGSSNNSWPSIKGLLIRSYQGMLMVSAVAATAVWLVLWYFDDAISDSRASTLRLSIILVPILSFLYVAGFAIRGAGKIMLGQIAEQLVRPVLFTVLFGLVVILSKTSITTAQSGILVNIAASGLALILVTYLIYRTMPGELWKSEAVFKTPEWLKSITLFSFVGGMQIIMSQTDIIMLGLLSQDTSVGIYRIAAQGGALVALTLAALNMALAPRIARLYNRKDNSELQRIITLGSRVALLGAVPIAAILIGFGSPILNIVFGREYVDGAGALAILCIGQLVNVASGSVALILNMTGHEKDTARAIGIAASLNILLNLVLIPRFDIEGAAIATAVSMITWNSFLAFRVYARTGLDSTVIGMKKEDKLK